MIYLCNALGLLYGICKQLFTVKAFFLESIFFSVFPHDYCWFVESYLSGCFLAFSPKILGFGRNIQRYSVILWMQVDWRGHSNSTCCNQIYLNFLHSDVVGDAKHLPDALTPDCACSHQNHLMKLSLPNTCFFVLFDWTIDIFTARKRSLGKAMFLHLSVSHSVHRGDVMMSLTVLDRTLPTAPTPWTAPPQSTRLRYTSYWNAFLFNNMSDNNLTAFVG